MQQPEHRAYVEAARLRAGLETDPRDVIRDYLLQRVERGTVWDRPDVVAALEEAGLEVPRQGDRCMTGEHPPERVDHRREDRCQSMGAEDFVAVIGYASEPFDR